MVIIVMGVSGCGKSTIASSIAESLGAYFKDADELHPQANIDRMANGEPLSDQHRQPWLEKVVDHCRVNSREHPLIVIACSALKKRYRKTLNGAGNVLYIHLVGSFELISSRMKAREGHFMPETLLTSQFRDLEVPTSEESVIHVNIDHEVPDLVEAVVNQIRENDLYQSALAN